MIRQDPEELIKCFREWIEESKEGNPNLYFDFHEFCTLTETLLIRNRELEETNKHLGNQVIIYDEFFENGFGVNFMQELEDFVEEFEFEDE